MNWWLGDCLRFGEGRWGEMYAQAVKASGKAAETARAAKWVAEKYPDPVNRLTGVSWTHHFVVAARDDRLELLRQAKADVEEGILLDAIAEARS